jgi:hypothetical protein
MRLPPLNPLAKLPFCPPLSSASKGRENPPLDESANKRDALTRDRAVSESRGSKDGSTQLHGTEITTAPSLLRIVTAVGDNAPAGTVPELAVKERLARETAGTKSSGVPVTTSIDWEKTQSESEGDLSDASDGGSGDGPLGELDELQENDVEGGKLRSNASDGDGNDNGLGQIGGARLEGEALEGKRSRGGVSERGGGLGDGAVEGDRLGGGEMGEEGMDGEADGERDFAEDALGEEGIEGDGSEDNELEENKFGRSELGENSIDERGSDNGTDGEGLEDSVLEDESLEDASEEVGAPIDGFDEDGCEEQGNDEDDLLQDVPFRPAGQESSTRRSHSHDTVGRTGPQEAFELRPAAQGCSLAEKWRPPPQKTEEQPLVVEKKVMDEDRPASRDGALPSLEEKAMVLPALAERGGALAFLERRFAQEKLLELMNATREVEGGEQKTPPGGTISPTASSGPVAPLPAPSSSAASEPLLLEHSGVRNTVAGLSDSAGAARVQGAGSLVNALREKPEPFRFKPENGTFNGYENRAGTLKELASLASSLSQGVGAKKVTVERDEEPDSCQSSKDVGSAAEGLLRTYAIIGSGEANLKGPVTGVDPPRLSLLPGVERNGPKSGLEKPPSLMGCVLPPEELMDASNGSGVKVAAFGSQTANLDAGETIREASPGRRSSGVPECSYPRWEAIKSPTGKRDALSATSQGSQRAPSGEYSHSGSEGSVQGDAQMGNHQGAGSVEKDARNSLQFLEEEGETLEEQPGCVMQRETQEGRGSNRELTSLLESLRANSETSLSRLVSTSPKEDLPAVKESSAKGQHLSVEVGEMGLKWIDQTDSSKPRVTLPVDGGNGDANEAESRSSEKQGAAAWSEKEVSQGQSRSVVAARAVWKE